MFKWGKNKVSPKQWVGVISLKNTTLEILPKIADYCEEYELMNSLIFMIIQFTDLILNIALNLNLVW